MFFHFAIRIKISQNHREEGLSGSYGSHRIFSTIQTKPQPITKTKYPSICWGISRTSISFATNLYESHEASRDSYRFVEILFVTSDYIPEKIFPSPPWPLSYCEFLKYSESSIYYQEIFLRGNAVCLPKSPNGPWAPDPGGSRLKWSHKKCLSANEILHLPV